MAGPGQPEADIHVDDLLFSLRFNILMDSLAIRTRILFDLFTSCHKSAANDTKDRSWLHQVALNFLETSINYIETAQWKYHGFPPSYLPATSTPSHAVFAFVAVPFDCYS